MSECKNRAFTLLEMLVVIAIIGVFSSLIAVRFDLIGTDTQRELERFRAFLKTQHARTIRNGISRDLSVDTGGVRMVSRTSTGTVKKTFRFDHWSFKKDEPFTIRVTPVGVFGPERFELRNGTKVESFVLDRLMVAKVSRQSDE